MIRLRVVHGALLLAFACLGATLPATAFMVPEDAPSQGLRPLASTFSPDDLAQVTALTRDAPRVGDALHRTLDAYDELAAAALTRRWTDAEGPIPLAQARLAQSLSELRLALDREPRALLPERLELAGGSVTIDFVGTDDLYTRHVTFLLDFGGADVYRNNAGGTGLRGLTCRDAGALPPTSVLADFAGNDSYESPDCGGNGGGIGGAGFLWDWRGDDRYVGASLGANGGGDDGAGYLYDGGGDDVYQAGSGGVNGGGSTFGSGKLIDVSGNDRYEAGGSGANGGGRDGGRGTLLDFGGDDVYVGGSAGVNGGGFFGSGRLVDSWGNDTYTALIGGVNGGSSGYEEEHCLAGSCVVHAVELPSLLIDLGGVDVYADGDHGTRSDESRIPSGRLGAQLDLASRLLWAEEGGR